MGKVARFTVGQAAAYTVKYTDSTAIASVSGSTVTITSANIGSDSGALLTLGKKYRLEVSTGVYRDCVYYDKGATTHIFRAYATAGTPGTTDITKITEIAEGTNDLTVSGMTMTGGLGIGYSVVNNDNYTVKTWETFLYVDATSAAVDITLPTITAANHGRVLIFKMEYTASDIDLIPGSGQQVNGAGADTKRTVTADKTEMFVADYYATTAPSWRLVFSV